MIKIEKMASCYLNEVKKLKVIGEQLKYVGKIEEILEKVNTDIFAHVIIIKEKVVGFFLIDTTYSSNYDFTEAGSLGLRAYFISSEFQGKGYGKQAVEILPQYLKENYSNYSKMFLTVNCKNNSAKYCYLNGGFIDTNKLYHGGEAGPQYIMQLEFP